MTGLTMETILQVKNLSVIFNTFEGKILALDRVGFDLFAGETLGIVGESGCGKSVTALSILRLIASPPGEVTSGQIIYAGKDLMTLSPSAMRDIRGEKISMIFQEPATSLSPVFTVGEQIAEVFRQHLGLKRREALEQSVEMLKKVNIPEPQMACRCYPYEMSGGMRQRVMIAMALACNPKVLLADEPTTALDVTIQAQVIDLIKQLQQDMGMSVIYITHDLGVVAHISMRVIVMYVGRIVEEAPVMDLLMSPMHPYTQGLIDSIPKLGEKIRGKKAPLKEIKGMVPSLLNLPPGCKFSERCRHVMDLCRQREPELMQIAPGRLCRCWLHHSKGENST